MSGARRVGPAFAEPTSGGPTIRDPIGACRSLSPRPRPSGRAAAERGLQSLIQQSRGTAAPLVCGTRKETVKTLRLPLAAPPEPPLPLLQRPRPILPEEARHGAVGEYSSVRLAARAVVHLVLRVTNA